MKSMRLSGVEFDTASEIFLGRYLNDSTTFQQHVHG